MSKRLLVVTADDYGIGTATSQGILELAVQGPVAAAVLLVNSPHAESAVGAWRKAGRPMELGWHPCLTLDRPVSPPDRVPSLIGADGRFWGLGVFIRRLLAGRVQPAEVEREFRAQLRRFRELVGHAPTLINTHHHVQVFPPIGAILARILSSVRPRPYVRRVREPLWMLGLVPGARAKRLLLTTLGRRDARRLERGGFPGNDWLAGVTDPACVADPRFLVRWLARVPGRVVELTCHPGFRDETLLGRDCVAGDGQVERRVREFRLLCHESFRQACRAAGFRVTAPAQVVHAARVLPVPAA